jgi:hypothetical protein
MNKLWWPKCRSFVIIPATRSRHKRVSICGCASACCAGDSVGMLSLLPADAPAPPWGVGGWARGTLEALACRRPGGGRSAPLRRDPRHAPDGLGISQARTTGELVGVHHPRPPLPHRGAPRPPRQHLDRRPLLVLLREQRPIPAQPRPPAGQAEPGATPARWSPPWRWARPHTPRRPTPLCQPLTRTLHMLRRPPHDGAQHASIPCQGRNWPYWQRGSRHLFP